MKSPDLDHETQSLRPRASVVVVNYQERAYLEELFTSLSRQTFQDFEVIFIDNASQDGSLDTVRSLRPGCQTVEQQRNLGFARAANQGARLAAGDLLAFLNPDLKLDPGWLEELIRATESDHRIAAVASKMLLYNDAGKLNGVGGMMNYLGYTWDRGMFEADRGQYDQPAEVLFASAGAALFRRSAFLEAGGFDERFFMYHEDVDLCWRLWLFGFRVVTAPRAVAFHHFGGSTRDSRGMLWRELMGERHNIRALLKNYQFPNLVRALTGLILLPQPWSRKLGQLRNLLWNLRVLPGTLRERRRIARRRVRNDQDLAHLIVESKDVPITL